MSDGHGGGGGSWRPLLEILGIIVGLWVLWYFTGGPQRAVQNGQLPFVNAPQPMGNGQIYDTNGNTITPQ